ncbi:transposase family protein [Archangium violaceum]|uniref:transposase family protein n=1 Tax=Archangium violaceum TaxID=83451 RepID=UPI0037C0DE5A
MGEHFSTLEDPSVEHTRRHPLRNVLMMALSAVMGGADNWESVHELAKRCAVELLELKGAVVTWMPRAVRAWMARTW